MTESNDDVNNKESDKLIRFKGYVFWNKAKLVKSYIIQFLKKTFPGKLIVPEFNKIDLVILSENIPVEIQSTPTYKNRSIMHSDFENMIRRQIEDNIENYDKCWFFFDSEYYRFLSESTNTQISVNLDWLSKYVKENKLKIFTIKYNGEIKELKYSDLDFIRNLSNTCKIEYNNDDRTLNRNKLKIMTNVLEGHKFTQFEIDKIIDNFNKRGTVGDNECLENFLIKGNNNREKQYGNILHGMGNLNSINDFLDMNSSCTKASKSNAERLNIVEMRTGRDSRTKFVDRFNICQYFPGYLRNKDNWNRIKDSHFTDNQLREVFFTFKSRKQKSMFEY